MAEVSPLGDLEDRIIEIIQRSSLDYLDDNRPELEVDARRKRVAAYIARAIIRDIPLREMRPTYSGIRYWLTPAQELNEKTGEYEW